MKRLLAVAISIAMGSGVTASARAAEPLIIQGSTTVTNAVMAPQKSAIETASNVKYEIISNGSSRGILAVAEGRAAIGMISAELDLEIAKVKAEHPGILDGKDLRVHRIGVAEVAFAVHPSNPVNFLRLAQITAILEGKIKNWSEVGGPEAAIIVIAEKNGGGIRSVVESRLSGDIKAQLREVHFAPQVNEIAAQLPAALALTTTASITAKVKRLETDEVISQPLNLVTLGEPTLEAAKIIKAAKAALLNVDQLAR